MVAHGEPLPTIGGETEHVTDGSMTRTPATPPSEPDEYFPISLLMANDNVIIETESDTEDALSPDDLSDEMLEIDGEDMEI